jgi:hypothetical protein
VVGCLGGREGFIEGLLQWWIKVVCPLCYVINALMIMLINLRATRDDYNDDAYDGGSLEKGRYFVQHTIAAVKALWGEGQHGQGSALGVWHCL